MKNLKKKIVLIISIFFALTIFLNNIAFAKNIKNNDNGLPYTESYKEWLKLSDEEKENYIMPRIFEIPYNSIEYNNPILRMKMVRSGLSSRFSLADKIPNNVTIKNQQQTNGCWAFSAISSLETNLALNDLKNGNQSKVYDFSERHMEYASSRVFKNNGINTKGFKRTVGSGGSWCIASAYLTNGLGAIDETQMPFENNEDPITIDQIQNKNVTSQVYDTIEFPDYNYYLFNENQKTEIINYIKTHIQEHGSVMGSIYTGSSSIASYRISDTTGALGVSGGTTPDHAISIIGWDDNYSKDNWYEFSDSYKPKNNGAWIARNSWGQESGDNGLLYISYEDKTLSGTLAGIVKAANDVDYENIYQHEYYYPNSNGVSGKKVILCNVFDKETSGKEYLNQVSLHVLDTYNCKVYVNPNGTGKSKTELKQVLLKNGREQVVNPGYHTLELARPVEIKSDQFLVAIEISSLTNSSVYPSYIKKDSDVYSDVEIQSGECYKLDSYEYIYNDNWTGWEDLKSIDRISTIKAFTTSTPKGGTLPEVLRGDANGDGKVDFADILVINKHRLKKVELIDIYFEVADVNDDGIVDIYDIFKINKYRLGKIDEV